MGKLFYYKDKDLNVVVDYRDYILYHEYIISINGVKFNPASYWAWGDVPCYCISFNSTEYSFRFINEHLITISFDNNEYNMSKDPSLSLYTATNSSTPSNIEDKYYYKDKTICVVIDHNDYIIYQEYSISVNGNILESVTYWTWLDNPRHCISYESNKYVFCFLNDHSITISFNNLSYYMSKDPNSSTYASSLNDSTKLLINNRPFSEFNLRIILSLIGIFLGGVVGYFSAHYFALWGGIALIGSPFSPARNSLVPGHVMFFCILFGIFGYTIGTALSPSRKYCNPDNSQEITPAPPIANLISNDDSKICPMCAETIKKAAKVCRYCNHKL